MAQLYRCLYIWVNDMTIRLTENYISLADTKLTKLVIGFRFTSAPGSKIEHMTR